jgi:hypothetical protein
MNHAFRPALPLRLRTPATLICVAALAACASQPPANPALAASASALESARSAGAPELAPVPLNNARTKLERARALAQAGRNREAIRMAEQSDADSQLARATAGSERSRRALAEVEASLQSLREELRRAETASPGGAPAAGAPAPLAPPRAPQQ